MKTVVDILIGVAITSLLKIVEPRLNDMVVLFIAVAIVLFVVVLHGLHNEGRRLHMFFIALGLIFMGGGIALQLSASEYHVMGRAPIPTEVHGRLRSSQSTIKPLKPPSDVSAKRPIVVRGILIRRKGNVLVREAPTDGPGSGWTGNLVKNVPSGTECAVVGYRQGGTPQEGVSYLDQASNNYWYKVRINDNSTDANGVEGWVFSQYCVVLTVEADLDLTQ